MGPECIDKRLFIGDLFESLDGEEERDESREFDVKGNPDLERIVSRFELWLETDNYDNFFDRAYKGIPHKRFSAKEIEIFSSIIINYQDKSDLFKETGIYLSALINRSLDKHFRLNISNLDGNLNYVGYRNTKNISIYGNLGSSFGFLMEKGVIKVFGNVGLHSGDNMQNGKLYIYGNAGVSIGHGMKNGEIHVFGDAKTAGHCMFDGKIYLNGDYLSISSNIKGGDIYHKGIQIIKDGKAVPGEEVRWRD